MKTTFPIKFIHLTHSISELIDLTQETSPTPESPETSSIDSITSPSTLVETSTGTSSTTSRSREVSTQTMDDNITNSIETKLSEKKEEIAASFASLENKTIDGVENIMEKVGEMGPMIYTFQQEMSEKIETILDKHVQEFHNSIETMKKNSKNRLNPMIGLKMPRNFGRMKRGSRKSKRNLV